MQPTMNPPENKEQLKNYKLEVAKCSSVSRMTFTLLPHCTLRYPIKLTKRMHGHHKYAKGVPDAVNTLNKPKEPFFFSYIQHWYIQSKLFYLKSNVIQWWYKITTIIKDSSPSRASCEILGWGIILCIRIGYPASISNRHSMSRVSGWDWSAFRFMEELEKLYPTGFKTLIIIKAYQFDSL